MTPPALRSVESMPSTFARKGVEIMIFADGVSVNFGSPHPWPPVASGDIHATNLSMIKALDKVRGYVQTHGIDLTAPEHDENVKELLTGLAKAGATGYNEFLSAEAENELDELEASRELSLNFFEMRDARGSFIWELLYTGDPLWDERIDVERFWGLRYPIGRTYLGVHDGENARLRSGVFAAHHQDLTASIHEIEELASYIQTLHLSQVGLMRLDLLEPAINESDELLRLLLKKDFGYGVVHLACHCETPDPNRDSEQLHDSFLLFTAKGARLRLTLASLIQNHKSHPFNGFPLVFLNACHSATPGFFLHKLTFPKVLLMLKASGVIATACIVPDEFAGAFALEFYQRLLSRSAANEPAVIAEVLHETRLHFWTKYRNPLGLAYGFYAKRDKELQISG